MYEKMQESGLIEIIPLICIYQLNYKGSSSKVNTLLFSTLNSPHCQVWLEWLVA